MKTCIILEKYWNILNEIIGNRIFFYSSVDFDGNHRNGKMKKLIVYTVYMFVDICMQMWFRRTRKAHEVVEAKNLYKTRHSSTKLIYKDHPQGFSSQWGKL